MSSHCSGLEVSVPLEGKGKEGTATRETQRFSPNLTLHSSPGHLEVLMPEDQKTKKGVTTLAGAINCDYREDKM